MSIQQFNKTQWIKVLEDSSESVGSFTCDHSFQLWNMRLQLYKHGIPSGSELIQIELYSEQAATSPIYTSNVVSLSDVTDQISGDYVLTWLRFDFDGVNIWANEDYYIKIVTANYTRSADTYYLGFTLDYPTPINSHSDLYNGLKIQFYEKK